MSRFCNLGAVMSPAVNERLKLTLFWHLKVTHALRGKANRRDALI